MLSREIMGTLCLAAVWVTALLVAAAAWQDLRDLLALRRRARRALCATIETTADDGPFAEWWVDQRGRALDSPDPAIAFHDRGYHSRIAGGAVRIGDRAYRVHGAGEVWASLEARTAAAACRDPSTFETAYAEATRATGYRRDVRVQLRKGETIFLLGELAGETVGGGAAPLIVSSFDPLGRLTRQSLAIATFIPAELAACAVATWVAVGGPHFGPRGVVGALLCLTFYLGVTPLAVALREWVQPPNAAPLRGTWARRLIAART